MSLVSDLRKDLESKKVVESVNQVPVVSNVTPVAAAKVPKPKEQKITMSATDLQAVIAAEVAKALSQVVATQVPVVATQQVVMTRISPYPAGISKRTGKAYPAGVKWHAQPHPAGTTAYGGLSMDDIGRILMNFNDGSELWADLNATFEKYGKTSNMYKKSKEEVIPL